MIAGGPRHFQNQNPMSGLIQTKTFRIGQPRRGDVVSQIAGTDRWILYFPRWLRIIQGTVINRKPIVTSASLPATTGLLHSLEMAHLVDIPRHSERPRHHGQSNLGQHAGCCSSHINLR